MIIFKILNRDCRRSWLRGLHEITLWEGSGRHSSQVPESWGSVSSVASVSGLEISPTQQFTSWWQVNTGPWLVEASYTNLWLWLIQAILISDWSIWALLISWLVDRRLEYLAKMKIERENYGQRLQFINKRISPRRILREVVNIKNNSTSPTSVKRDR